ncbi:MAG: hypothetical protein JW876_07570 [Candidatus Krumholzibacteriota bacterium]|nr:hypothetical protein [Candidatus Krumholzibacteriota bacterium]
MESFELREEIAKGGRSYFLQTSFLPRRKIVQSSFFVNGELFDRRIDQLAEAPAGTDARTFTKHVHNENKDRFLFLLGAREKIRKMDDAVAHLRLAEALCRRNLFEEAIQEARLSIDKGNGDSAPYVLIGRAKLRLEEYGEAFEAVQKGIEINPEYPDLHNLIGLVYLHERKCAPAIESFKRAIALNIYYGEPYLNLARAYLLNSVVKEDYELSKDLDEKFEKNLSRAVELNPFIQGEIVDRARALFREEKYEEALAALDEASGGADRGGIREIVLELYLLFLQSGGDLDVKAIDGYLDRVREMLDRNPTYADGYNALGILYTAQCKLLMDSAASSFRRALEINRNYRKAQKNLRLTENDRQGIFILLKALLD